MAVDYQLEHDAARQRFFFDLPQGECYIDYRAPAHGVYDLAHTWTSKNQRGKGLAGQLTQAVLAWMQANQAQVLPTCPYIADFIRKHPDFEPLLANT